MQQFEMNTEASKGGELNSSVQAENLQTSGLFIKSIRRSCMPGFKGIMSSGKGKTDMITDPLHCVTASVKPQIGKTLTLGV